MQNNLFSVASEKGRTKWLQQYLLQHLPELEHNNADYHHWRDSLIQFMENRGLVEPTQQKDYLSDVRNAIRVLNPSHPALEVIDFDKETWIAINNHNTDRIAERTTKFIDNPHKIVEIATLLLKSYQWSEIAAGLAVLTGRRSTEVIKTAQFEYKSKFSVVFTGALKRGDEPVECTFEIPTLCEAQLVIDAISSLREKLGAEISNLSKRQVSRRYGKAVASKCDRYFSELVPPRDDKDNLYTHLFRAVYATIASYWYCPPTIPEMEYRAAIQGHYQILDEQNPDLRRSLAAGRHYFDYKIADGNGNIDGRLGIKLNLPDVQIIEQFKHTTIKTKPTIMTEQSNSPMSIPNFYRSRLDAICEKLDIPHEDAIQALFTWTEMALSLADSLDTQELTPQGIFKSVEQLKNDAKGSSSIGINQGDSKPSFNQDQESIRQLSTSVRMLTELLNQQQNSGQYGTAQVSSSSNRRRTRRNLSDEAQPVEPIRRLPSNRKTSERGIEAEDSVNQGIDAIIDFNNVEDRPAIDKWYIGIGCLRKLTERGDNVIKRVLKSRKEEIDAHNSLHELGKWHNARGKDYPSIETIIPF